MGFSFETVGVSASFTGRAVLFLLPLFDISASATTSLCLWMKELGVLWLCKTVNFQSWWTSHSNGMIYEFMVFIHLFRILRKCSFWVTLKYLKPNHKPYSFWFVYWMLFVPIKIWRLWYINIFNKNLRMQNRWIASEVFEWQMSITIRLSRLIDCDCRSFRSLMVGSTIFFKQMFDFLLKVFIIKMRIGSGIFN